MNIEHPCNDLMLSSRVLIEHNYSTNCNDFSLNGSSTSDFNIPVHQKVN